MEKRGRVRLRPEHSGCVLPDKNEVVFNSRSSLCYSTDLFYLLRVFYLHGYFIVYVPQCSYILTFHVASLLQWSYVQTHSLCLEKKTYPWKMGLWCIHVESEDKINRVETIESFCQIWWGCTYKISIRNQSTASHFHRVQNVVPAQDRSRRIS